MLQIGAAATFAHTVQVPGINAVPSIRSPVVARAPGVSMVMTDFSWRGTFNGKPKGAEYDNLVTTSPDTLTELKADLAKLIKSTGCGPIMIRLSWHDAGVYSTGKLTGGCPNAAMRFTDGGEGTFGANAGLPDVAVGL